MAEISIKIKGLKQFDSSKKKKKEKKVMTKPKTKTDSYLEKIKAREYSFNMSPFYDYKTGLQPTYITRQPMVPQLQQDAKHLDLITLLEEFKKKDMREQTGKLKHDSSPFWPGVNDPINRLVSDQTIPGSENQTGFTGRLGDNKPKVDEAGEELDEEQDAKSTPQVMDYDAQASKKELEQKEEELKEEIEKQEKLSKELAKKEEENKKRGQLKNLEDQLKNVGPQLSHAKSDLNKAIEKGKKSPNAVPSSKQQTRINQLTAKKEQLETQKEQIETQIKDLKKSLKN